MCTAPLTGVSVLHSCSNSVYLSYWWTGSLRCSESLSAHWSAWILSGLLCFPTNSLIIMARGRDETCAWVWSTHPLFPIKRAMDFLYRHIKIEKDERRVWVASRERGCGQQWMRWRRRSEANAAGCRRWLKWITHSCTERKQRAQEMCRVDTAAAEGQENGDSGVRRELRFDLWRHLQYLNAASSTSVIIKAAFR